MNRAKVACTKRRQLSQTCSGGVDVSCSDMRTWQPRVPRSSQLRYCSHHAARQEDNCLRYGRRCTKGAEKARIGPKMNHPLNLERRSGQACPFSLHQGSEASQAIFIKLQPRKKLLTKFRHID